MANRQPLTVNMILYAGRDGMLFDEVANTPANFRAERVRQLANLGCILPSLLGAVKPAGLPVDLIRSVTGSAPAQSNSTDEELIIKLSVNAYNYTELFEELASAAPGTLSARVKRLAEAGLVLNRLAQAGRSVSIHVTDKATEDKLMEGWMDEGGAAEQPEPSPTVVAGEGEPVTQGVKEGNDEGVGQQDQGDLRQQQRRRSSSAISSIKM